MTHPARTRPSSSPSRSDASCGCSRRGFLGSAISCGAYVLFAAGAATSGQRRAWAAEPKTAGGTIHSEDFARVEKIADGIWSVVSTPLDETGKRSKLTTMSNGGIIAGKDATLVIEGFNTPEGAAWQSDLALELTGRRPDYVIATHFHPDHTNGLPGYAMGGEAPAIVATAETRRLLMEKIHGQPPTLEGQALDGSKNIARSQRRLFLPDAIVADESQEAEIDLGDRTVRLFFRQGHTPSDTCIEISDPHVVWTGDLVFNGMFPYYGDALPSAWNESIEALQARGAELYTPGHGAMMRREELGPYLELLRDVERAARQAHAAGTPASAAWKEYETPERLGEILFFRPDIVRHAFEAWERELNG